MSAPLLPDFAGLAEDVLDLIDRSAARTILVFGSLPPAGRDLDILARGPEYDQLCEQFSRAGLRRVGHRWAAFGRFSACAVDLVRAEDWTLPASEIDALFTSAVRLHGRQQLAAPAPEHRLLILATRVMPGGGALSEHRRQRVRQALTDDPSAWERAHMRADAWGTATAAQLDAIRHAEAATGRRVIRPRRILRRAARLAQPRVIALSGIDGAGKSTQARLLKEALERLGYEVDVAWLPLAQNLSLKRLAAPVKGLLQLRSSSTSGAGTARSPVAGTARSLGGGDHLRRDRPALNAVWIATVAVANGMAHRRIALRGAARGRIVIFDRYVLDSAARLRFFYAPDGLLGVQNALVRVLSPRPVCTFFLDLPPEQSLRRKDDVWTSNDLALQARLYREDAARSSPVRVDATEPPEQLAAAIAFESWRRLS